MADSEGLDASALVATVSALVAAVSVLVAAVSVATAAAAVALLAEFGEVLRALTFPPDDVTALARAEWAVLLVAVVESLPPVVVEPLSELLAEAFPAPDPAPVSA
ncbi:hypothetical protein BayCH28_03675 [Mycolicibacterium sp. CH28]|uniref:hypothetical protein n=1 Tax=Mycolicibacterium sp. CH28 TaxID=2512237 RepID=UPI0010804DD3|nr:hypothetical protein [Mycolicibacterium sp. CH28]TGD89710.1 hypothetical protein BayCH28_03675 [Mycolicibacterium sp. CH28]